METYLQYRCFGNRIRAQLERDVEDARHLKCVSRQQTRIVGDRAVLVVDWDDEEDPMNPRNWPTRRKIRAFIIVALIAFLVGAVAPIDAPVLPQAAKDLGVSEVTESLSQAVFLIGFGVGAIIVGPFSEVLGRNFSYIVPLSLFCVWVMASALSPNIGAQVVFRFLAGFCGATPLVCAGGSLSDMYTPLEKTYMFPLFAFCGFGGPALGPVMTAWIADSTYLHSWRWADWVALMTSGVVFIIAFLFMPETYAPTLLSWKAKQLRKISGDDRYYALAEIDRVSLTHRLTVALPRPFVMAFHEPVIILITVYLSVLYIVLFTFFVGYIFIFQETYGISQGLTNTIFVGIVGGVFMGALPLPWIYKKTLQAQAEAESQGRKQFSPEVRLLNSMAGAAVLLPVSLLWMGWTAYPHISIWSPICASVLFGYCTIGIFISSYMYLIDMYEVMAASGLGFATFTRYLVCGGMTVVGIPFYEKMGVHWTLTILACISALLAPIPYVFYKYGHTIRRKSKFAVKNLSQAPERGAGSSQKTGPLEVDTRLNGRGAGTIEEREGQGSASQSPSSDSSATAASVGSVDPEKRIEEIDT